MQSIKTTKLMQIMHKMIVENKKGRIEIEFVANTSNKQSHNLTHAGTFILKPEMKLPKEFKWNKETITCKIRLIDADNIVSKITCTGKLKYKDLKQAIKTIFDIKYIKRMNGAAYYNKHRNTIKQLTEEVLGKEESDIMINKLDQLIKN